MEDYNKIIESLSVRFIKAKNIRILQPITIQNFYDVENTILYVHKGQIRIDNEGVVIPAGSLLFIPGGKSVAISYGTGTSNALTNDDFINEKDKYFENFSPGEETVSDLESFSYVTFEAKVFDSVNFFASLDIPPFLIENNKVVNELIKSVLYEVTSTKPGKNRIVKLETDHIVVEIVRYILENRLFVEQLATNSTYFKDPRLIDIFAYIKENLGGDLSNKTLASVANVSEDYVGQYFKMLTGINPQDYIEYQRMEMAVNLLRTSKKSIREIGREVGYKDTAYFCRRFKMMFGIPAGKMRRRESLMNV